MTSDGQEFAKDEGVLHNYIEFCDWSIRAIQREFPILRSRDESGCRITLRLLPPLRATVEQEGFASWPPVHWCVLRKMYSIVQANVHLTRFKDAILHVA